MFTGKEYDGPSGWGAKNPAPLRTNEAQLAAKAIPVPQKTDSEVLSEKIDQLGTLVQEEAKLRADITAQMKKLNFKRHFGSNFRAELQETSKVQFTDKEKLVEFLRKVNLLTKTLVPTQSTILDLLQDTSVPDEIKQQLRSFIQQTPNLELHITKES